MNDTKDAPKMLDIHALAESMVCKPVRPASGGGEPQQFGTLIVRGTGDPFYPVAVAGHLMTQREASALAAWIDAQIKGGAK